MRPNPKQKIHIFPAKVAVPLPGGLLATRDDIPHRVCIYICGLCDKVHVSITAPDMETILLDLSHADADQLARELLNPEPLMLEETP